MSEKRMETFDEWWAREVHQVSHLSDAFRKDDVEKAARIAWDAAKREVYSFTGLADGARCVLQRWAWKLPLMQQTVLITAVRGPDGTPKNTPAKSIVKLLRGAVLISALPEGGEFMPMLPESERFEQFEFHREALLRDLDFYPMHFLMHLAHAVEILGYKHPDGFEMDRWRGLYYLLCDAWHFDPETEERLDERLAL